MTDLPTRPALEPGVVTPATRHVGLTLAAIVAIAGALRMLLPWPSVFAENYVSFLETDAWYHMRLVDALVANFPWRLWQDPYLVHPGGEPVNAGPVFDWIIAAVALVLGGGSPSERLVDVVGACTPPVIGALTVLPVFVLGRELWSARAGLWAAFMVAVMPGQLLERSLLGFTDHHCLETLLSTTTMMCVVIALKRDATSARRWALAGGVSLGAYLLTWGGGVLFVAFIVAWAGLQLAVDAVLRQRKRRRDAGCRPGVAGGRGDGGPVGAGTAVLRVPVRGAERRCRGDLGAACLPTRRPSARVGTDAVGRDDRGRDHRRRPGGDCGPRRQRRPAPRRRLQDLSVPQSRIRE